MTVKDRLKKMIEANGPSEQQSEAIMEIAMPELDKKARDYTITFDSPASDYPDLFYTIWYSAIKPIALQWIDENKPQAWFRDMFVTKKA
jgi:hypothetical protein